MTEIKPGAVIRLPKGSHAAKYVTEVAVSPRKLRKQKVVVVEFVFPEDDAFSFIDRFGKHEAARLSDAELVTEVDHTLRVEKRNLGGHPIAGWNWPVWGYDYECACGASLADREDHWYHLEELAS